MKNVIVILNYNDSDDTIRLVNSIIDYDSIHDIVIVDNCSTDDSFEKITNAFKYDSYIHMMQTKKNGGYAFGNNVGCKYAVNELKAEYLTIANPDIDFENEVLAKMVEFVSTHGNAGCVAPYMNCNKRNQSPMAWKLPTFIDCLMESTVVLARLCRKRVVYTEDYLKGDEAVLVDVVAGSFFTIKAKVLKACGWFDEDTFLYYEENILASKLKKNRKVSYILSDCQYYHRSSESIDNVMRNVRKKLSIANKSRCVYLKKCCGCSGIIPLNNLFSWLGIGILEIVKRIR